MHKSNSGFCTSQSTLGEINFRSKLRLKTTSTNQIFLFENCCLGKKRRSKVAGTFRKLLEWGAEIGAIALSYLPFCIDDSGAEFHAY